MSTVGRCFERFVQKLELQPGQAAVARRQERGGFDALAAQAALTQESRGEHRRASECWRELFGPEFPLAVASHG
ncbi:hypothetical protein LZ198_10480 [Myxococcus sp. K15C18031901]|uniref:hypothetical protein n=1 Tax=Myxococcus dinghuensis TaxID=2906761 RepID=UPI0020A81D85|nr:hypothetical protein [Myxococcus dinghuensis]MCP3099297.1 hypothetical protein [Myxococcus dinghuensis]